MPATYPTTKFTWSARVDNVDDVLAADVNSLALEVIAIEDDLLGAGEASGLKEAAASFHANWNNDHNTDGTHKKIVGTTQALPVTLKDNTANAFEVKQGTDQYFDAQTTDDGESAGVLDNDVLESASQLPISAPAALTFPNTTTLYIWNMDSTTDTAADGAYAGNSYGGQALTLKAQKLTASNDVLGNSKYNTIIAGGYLTSTNAAFNVENTADTDDFMVGGWVYLPDTTPAANVVLFSNSGGANHGWEVWLDTNGNLWGRINLATDLDTSVNFLPAASGWYHIVLTREVGVCTRLFVNGNEVGWGADGAMGTTQSKFQLGGRNGATSPPEVGTRYDEVFWKKGVLPTNLADVVRAIYVRSAKKFAAKDQNTNIVIPQNVSSGIYTPVITAGTNVAACSASRAYWQRVGDVVTVTGYGSVDPTAGSTETLFTLSLPIFSDLTSVYDVAGHIAVGSASTGGYGVIYGVVASNVAQVDYIAITTANDSFGYTFSYVIK